VIKAFFFDMDGTILEGVADGLPEFKQTWGIAPDQLVVPNLPRLPSAAREAFMQLEERVAAESILRSGVIELLLELKQKNIVTALLTNNSSLSAQTVTQKHQISFDLILSRDTASAMKPAPDMLRQALKHFELETHNAIMIGDTRHDVGAARAAGLRCYLISEPWNHNLEDDNTRRVNGISGLREALIF
jgi:HAD superfamily hydrolase (TIGR01509 family)